jgi:ubiquinone/menaquinone biosynthesis C-methylase UbiE/acyl carrier protein
LDYQNYRAGVLENEDQASPADVSRAEGSYILHNFAASVDHEILRLKAQVDLFWEKELGCLRRVGLRDGMRILECGCGPGYVLEKLLHSFPASEVTGIEIDPFLAEKSKENLAAFIGNRCRIDEQSITEMDFADHSFDFVIVRLVLEHLPDPLKAVREVYRVLKAGGKGVFIDNDFHLHLRSYPDIPELDDLYDAYCRCRIAEGGNPYIGRELPSILQDGGFSNIDLDLVSAHSRVVGDKAFLRSEGTGIPAQLVKDGYLAREVMDSLARKWHEALQHEHHVLFRQLFLAVGEKIPSDVIRIKPATQRIEIPPPSPAVQDILRSDSPPERSQLLAAYLQTHIATSLRIPQASVPVHRPLIALGVDSITSVELANRMASDFGITLSITEILEAKSIIALAARLHDGMASLMRQDITPWPAPQPGSPEEKRAGWSHDPCPVQTGWEEGQI